MPLNANRADERYLIGGVLQDGNGRVINDANIAPTAPTVTMAAAAQGTSKMRWIVPLILLLLLFLFVRKHSK